MIVSTMYRMQSANRLIAIKVIKFNCFCYFISIFRCIRKSDITFLTKLIVLRGITIHNIRKFVFTEVYHCR